jgi:hypothetical protein
MADPVRLWVGVPTSLAASGNKLVLDATTVAPLASPVFTGDPKAPTPAPGDNDTSISTTAFVRTALQPYAPLASPVLTGDPQAPTPATQDNDTSIATTAFVKAAISAGPPAGALINDVAPAALPGTLWFDSLGGQLYVRYDDGNSQQWVTAANMTGLANAATKADVAPAFNAIGQNLLHNPLFNVAQRGAGPWTTSVYTADRWFLGVSLDTVSLSTVAAADADRSQIGDEAASRYLQCNFTGNAGAGAVSYVHQPMEGVRRLGGKTVTVSFWAAASSAALKLGINIYQNFGSGGSPSAGVWVLATGNAIPLATTWARYTTTIAIPSTAGKTLGSAGDEGTWLRFFYSAGSSSAAMAGNIGVQSGTISIWGVQLEIAQPGQTQPTPLEKPDPRYDLANCQRFYQGPLPVQMAGLASASGTIAYNATFPTTMRATPTIVYNSIGQVGCSGTSVGAQSASVWQYSTNVTGSYNTNGTFTASADL